MTAGRAGASFEGRGTASLGTSMARSIAAGGPLSVAQFMAEGNARYYAARDPLGAQGDFTTAPEIGQVFGELIGLALADVWQRAGSPRDVVYAELGPGRGTLARDALRAMATQRLTPRPVLVEASAALRDLQDASVPGAAFVQSAAELPDDAPLLVVANEFFDALGVRQLVRTNEGWRERVVALLDGKDEGGDDGADAPVRLGFATGGVPMDAALPASLRGAPEGTIVETCPAACAIMRELAGRLVRQGGAMLVFDYGHDRPRTGSTLQAVRRHRKVDPLTAAGDADLTAHLDFHALAETAAAAGARVEGIAPQGGWLEAMGIAARTQALAAAHPDRAEELAASRKRLTDRQAMGDLFKVMIITAPGWPPML